MKLQTLSTRNPKKISLRFIRGLNEKLTAYSSTVLKLVRRQPITARNDAPNNTNETSSRPSHNWEISTHTETDVCKLILYQQPTVAFFERLQCVRLCRNLELSQLSVNGLAYVALHLSHSGLVPIVDVDPRWIEHVPHQKKLVCKRKSLTDSRTALNDTPLHDQKRFKGPSLTNGVIKRHHPRSNPRVNGIQVPIQSTHTDDIIIVNNGPAFPKSDISMNVGELSYFAPEEGKKPYHQKYQDGPVTLVEGPVHAVLQQPIVDLYQTTPEIGRYLESLKNSMMMAEIEQGRAIPKSRLMPTAGQFPHALDAIATSQSAYISVDNQTIDDDALFSVRADKPFRVNQLVTKHGPQLLECLITCNDQADWIYVTQFDVFVQNDRGVDDCAHQRTSIYSRKPIAAVIRKSESHCRFWFEVTVRWGNLEFLAIAGFYGKFGSTTATPFLGSALPITALNTKDTDFARPCTLQVPKHPVDFVKSVRLLRDYSKTHADHTWSFASRRFVEKGFYPCHPLAYNSHPTRLNCKPNAASLASALLSCCVNATFSLDDRHHLMDLLLKTPDMAAVCKKKSTQYLPIQSLQEGLAHLKAAKPKSNVLKPLQVAVKLEKMLLKAGPSVSIDLTMAPPRSVMLELYKNVLVSPIKTANKTLVSKYFVSHPTK